MDYLFEREKQIIIVIIVAGENNRSADLQKRGAKQPCSTYRIYLYETGLRAEKPLAYS